MPSFSAYPFVYAYLHFTFTISLYSVANISNSVPVKTNKIVADKKPQNLGKDPSHSTKNGDEYFFTKGTVHTVQDVYKVAIKNYACTQF